MSDILRAKETEDVLSSIRRLVSAEPRQSSQKQVLQGEAVAGGERSIVLGAQPAPLQIKQPEEGRLVLGPALRVSEQSPLNPLLLGRRPAHETIPETPIEAKPEAVEATTFASMGAENLGANVTAFPKAAETMQHIRPEVEEEVEDAPFIEILDEPSPSAEVTPFPFASETVVAPAPVYEPDEEEAEVFAEEDKGADTEEFEAESEAEEPRGHWSAQHLPEVSWIAEAGSEWDDEESRAFEALRRQLAPEDQPQMPPEWADEAEAEVRARLLEPRMETGELVGPVESANMFAAPSLDEAALRDIVRQLIREELSGSLGERITRNVRKLVRIEVNRALTNSTLE